jgi:hypothetical protein
VSKRPTRTAVTFQLQRPTDCTTQHKSMWTRKNFFASRREGKVDDKNSTTKHHRRTKSSEDSTLTPRPSTANERAHGTTLKTSKSDDDMAFIFTSEGLKRHTGGKTPPIDEQFALLRRHALVGQYVGLQVHDYENRYEEFPHAERRREYIASLEKTQVATFSHLTPYQQKVLRARASWELRKRMLIDSAAYKEHIYTIRRRYEDSVSEEKNVLKYFVALLVEDGGEMEWPEDIRKQREWNAERKKELESEVGLVFSRSGPGVRKQKLLEAEARLGLESVSEEAPESRVLLRPELRIRRGRSGSMEAMVGDKSQTRESEVLDSPCSDADERDEAHFDSLRAALAAVSHGPPLLAAPSGTTIHDFATATATDPFRDPARLTTNWAPISPTDQQYEELERQRSREESRDDGWGTDSEEESEPSDSGNEASAGAKEEDNSGAEMAVGQGEKAKMEGGKVKEEKTSIAVSFPGRSFF